MKTKQITPAKAGKKEFKALVAYKLGSSFGDIRDIIGEKKFARKIKKATKAITAGVAKKVRHNTMGEREIVVQ